MAISGKADDLVAIGRYRVNLRRHGSLALAASPDALGSPAATATLLGLLAGR